MAFGATLPQDRPQGAEALEEGHRSSVMAALAAASILPGPTEYAACRRAVTRAGVEACLTTQQIVGARLWNWMLGALRRPAAQEDCERVLGFGRLLTEWMLPTPLTSDRARNNVVALGGLANFIVTVFDHLVDESEPGHWPLAAGVVERACAGDLRPLRVAAFIGRPPARLLARMVLAYFSNLDGLPYASRHADVNRLLRRTIVAMYAAERETLVMRDPNERAVRRKAALPFVVMGLASWLAVPKGSPDLLRSHLRWLYQLGDVLATVDDLADVKEDLAAGRSNRVVAMIESEEDGSRSWELPATVARRARRLVEERSRWHAEVTDRGDVDHAFGAVIISWLGGHAPSARDDLRIPRSLQP